MEILAIPVLNVGGRLGEDDNGVLKYIDGVQESFDALDVDLLNISDLEAMAKTLGYPTYTAMHWLDPIAANLEFGLRNISKDCDIIELRNVVVANGCVDFKIYFEHPISNPILAEGDETDPVVGCVNLDSDGENKSSSHDSYESAEDEAYKPPPDGYEDGSDTDCGESLKVRKRGRIKKIMTPKKKGSPKNNPKKIPIRRSSRINGTPEKAAGDGNAGDEGLGEERGEAAAENRQNVKKKGSRKYAGKRKEKNRPNLTRLGRPTLLHVQSVGRGVTITRLVRVHRRIQTKSRQTKKPKNMDAPNSEQGNNS